MKFKLFFMIFLAIFFISCAEKGSKLYNLPPQEWYSQILDNIKLNQIKKADENFVSFSSEHVNSPYLEQIMLILARVHMEKEEYLIANYYLDSYIKKYGDFEKIEYAKYLKIKANFDSFTKPSRNLKLVEDSIYQIEMFLFQYPNTIYRPLLETMRTKFILGQVYTNQQILDLYERTGKKESAEVYRKKLENNPFKNIEILPPKTPWYVKIFE